MSCKNPIPNSIEHISTSLVGLIYIPLMLSYLIIIRGMEKGAHLVLLLLIITWMGDMMAYYTGTLWGKHPLCPAISPKKTVEGTIGGLAGSSISALIYKALFFPKLSIFAIILLAIVVNIIGQVGDLSESIIKRWAGVKDSGSILPGHGGMLDRVDALIFSAPAFYYFLTLVLMRM